MVSSEESKVVYVIMESICRLMINKPSAFEGLQVRIAIISPIKGRGFKP